MKVLILGSGGREHALCYACKKSPKINQIYCIPGNAGTNLIAENINIELNDFEKIKEIINKNKIDFVIVGPEHLGYGIVDFLSENKIKDGPNKIASIRRFKIFTKIFVKNIIYLQLIMVFSKTPKCKFFYR